MKDLVNLISNAGVKATNWVATEFRPVEKE